MPRCSQAEVPDLIRTEVYHQLQWNLEKRTTKEEKDCKTEYKKKCINTQEQDCDMVQETQLETVTSTQCQVELKTKCYDEPRKKYSSFCTSCKL